MKKEVKLGQNSGIDGGEWLLLCSGILTSGKEHLHSFEPQRRPGYRGEHKNSFPWCEWRDTEPFYLNSEILSAWLGPLVSISLQCTVIIYALRRALKVVSKTVYIYRLGCSIKGVTCEGILITFINKASLQNIMYKFLEYLMSREIIKWVYMELF